MAEAATDPMLKNAFNEHLEQTRTQVQRLEQIFRSAGKDADREACDGIKGLLKEGEEMIHAKGDDDTRDAGLIAAAQRVEHYEIAAYGTAIAHARLLGLDQVVELLEETLGEEKAADEKLTEVAETVVNADAASADEESEEGEMVGAASGGRSGQSSRRGSNGGRAAGNRRGTRNRSGSARSR